MKIITGNTRIMRDEYASKGIKRNTREIRRTYDFATLRSNLTHIPNNETQVAHRHLLVTEAIHVLAGRIQVQVDNHWKTVCENEAVLFNLTEIHKLRTSKHTRALYPGVSEDTAAVAIVFKWIPPYLSVRKHEVGFIIQNDWFSDEYKDHNGDPETSPVLRLKKVLQQKFWRIVNRNLSLPSSTNNIG